jgi:hypothetical protein
MRIGMTLGCNGGFIAAVEELRNLESAGLDIVFVAEGYSFDAVSQLGYIAAKTDRLEIASGIMQLYSRTPTLPAMTAAGRPGSITSPAADSPSVSAPPGRSVTASPFSWGRSVRKTGRWRPT